MGNRKLPSSLAGVRAVAAAEQARVELDDLDLSLLQALSTDGRASQRHLASTLGVSTPTVSERMSRLERAGVITGYAASIDWAAVGFAETVYLSVTAADSADVSAVMTALWSIPEVQGVNLITGDLDLLVCMRVRDYAHMRALLMENVWQIEGLQGTSTLLCVAEMPTKNFAAGLLGLMRGAPPRRTGR